MANDDMHDIVAEVQAPARWEAALAALAEALGVQDTEQLEALLREHLGEFVSVPKDGPSLDEKAARIWRDTH